MRSPSPPPPSPYPCPLDCNSKEAGGRGGAALIPNTASSLLTFLYKYKYIVQLWGELGSLVRGILGCTVATSHLTRLMLAAQGASCDGGGEWLAVSHHHRVVRVTPPPPPSPTQLMQRKSRVQRRPWPGPGPPLQHAALCSTMQHYAVCSTAV